MDIKLAIKHNTQYTYTEIHNYIFYITSAVIIGIFLIFRTMSFIGYIILIENIIVNLIVVSHRNKSFENTLFYQDLYKENNINNPKRENLIKIEKKLIVSGIIIGIIAILPVYIVWTNLTNSGKNLDYEILGAITAIVGIISMLKIFPAIVERKQFKMIGKYKEITEKYWVLMNILANSYIVSMSISCFILLVFIIKIEIVLSAGISLVMYWIIRHKLEINTEIYGDDDPDRTLAKIKERDSQEEKSSFGISTVTRFDEKGNYAGSATTYNVGGVEFTDVKDKNGKVEGSATSFEFGGVKHTTYKKQ